MAPCLRAAPAVGTHGACSPSSAILRWARPGPLQEGQSPGRTEPGPRAQKRGPSLGGALSRAVQPAGSYAVLCCILKIYFWLTVLLQGQGPQLETAVLGAESQEGTGHHVTEVWCCCVLASLPQPWELPLGNLSNPNHLPKARL